MILYYITEHIIVITIILGMATTQEMLEQENDQLVDTLKDKVSTLRTVSIIYCTCY